MRRPRSARQPGGPRGLLAAALLVALGTLAPTWPDAAAAAQPGIPALAPGASQVAAIPEVSAAGAVLWDPADDRVLYGKQEAAGRPMASTTKIMTALLALEAGVVDEEIMVSSTAAALGEIGGAANLGLVAGQRVPARSLLTGLIVRSGNDAAVAVAEHVAGSEAAFVEKMNARAAELGLESTGFVNASGLTDDLSHQASPLDLARLAQVAMSHPDFAAWAATTFLDVPGLPRNPSRNELLTIYPGATGVKTGYTDLAGLCLVASATRDGRTLFAVVLGSQDSFADAIALLNHGFDDFRRPAPLGTGDAAAVYRWAGVEVAALAAETLTATAPVTARVTWRAVLDAGAQPPVEASAPLGTGQLLIDGEVVRETQLHAATAVAPVPRTGDGAVGAALQDAVRAFSRLHVVERAA
ncbi:MAG TPA: D-alanyl-D-alanine carboxypeptidase family protein [Egibacteraceae bacterium]|nr:D-alanyl-D-alanine carboxypeptidase family protein [Egibacteraceae bacterium]